MEKKLNLRELISPGTTIEEAVQSLEEEEEEDHFNFNHLIQQQSILSRITKPTSATKEPTSIFERLQQSYRTMQDKKEEPEPKKEELVMRLAKGRA